MVQGKELQMLHPRHHNNYIYNYNYNYNCNYNYNYNYAPDNSEDV